MLKLLCYNGSVISKVLRRTTGGAGILLVLLIVPINPHFIKLEGVIQIISRGPDVEGVSVFGVFA